MTALHLADAEETAELGGFLTRLLRFDKAAAVRLQTANRGLAVFARLPLGQSGPLVVRTAALAPSAPRTAAAPAAPVDVTLAAGELLEAIDATPVLALPSAITGPAWAGLLPPRHGWERLDDLPAGPLRAAVSAAVTEFRRESADQDALAESIWSRQVDPSGLTLRAVHAAHLVGLLRQAESLGLYRHPAWLRLAAPRGYVIIRRAPAPGTGLGLSPTR